PDAGIHAREPRGPAPARWRDPPGRDRRGKNLAVGTLRPMAVVLPLHPGRLPGHRRPLAAGPRLPRRPGPRRARRSAAMDTGARLPLRAGRPAIRARLGRPPCLTPARPPASCRRAAPAHTAPPPTAARKRRRAGALFRYRVRSAMTESKPYIRVAAG